ncbi:MAG: hypothetical protein ACI4U5_06710, partial [Bacilli bacterium]
LDSDFEVDENGYIITESYDPTYKERMKDYVDNNNSSFQYDRLKSDQGDKNHVYEYDDGSTSKEVRETHVYEYDDGSTSKEVRVDHVYKYDDGSTSDEVNPLHVYEQDEEERIIVKPCSIFVNGKKQIHPLIITYIVLVIFSTTLINTVFPLLFSTIFEDIDSNLLLSFTLFLNSILLIILTVLLVKLAKKRHTEEVIGTVVSYQKTHSNNSTKFAPKIAYEYKGKKYLYKDNVYSSKVPMGEVKLYISPTDPMDVFYKSNAGAIIIFIAIALICISTIVGIGR